MHAFDVPLLQFRFIWCPSAIYYLQMFCFQLRYVVRYWFLLSYFSQILMPMLENPIPEIYVVPLHLADTYSNERGYRDCSKHLVVEALFQYCILPFTPRSITGSILWTSYAGWRSYVYIIRAFLFSSWWLPYSVLCWRKAWTFLHIWSSVLLMPNGSDITLDITFFHG